MRRSAIGVFDSGIGGLTVANEIGRQLPHEDIIYLGDTARLPTEQRALRPSAGMLNERQVVAKVL